MTDSATELQLNPEGLVQAFNPARGEPGPAYPAASVAAAEAAVDAAAAAFGSGALRDPARRAALLRGSATALRANADRIVSLAAGETGLIEGRLRGELERTAGQLEAFADVVMTGDHVEAIIDRADAGAVPPRPDLRRMLVPIGPVVVFGASNFPLAFSTAGGDTASAWGAGCPVVVKGHPAHPGTSTLVAQLLSGAVADAGLPAGTFSHVLASELGPAEALVDHPATEAVAFTGSLGAGRAVHDRAAARPRPIPVYAEMGSVNPIVVTAAALAARGSAIAAGLAASVGTHAGQLCTKPGVVFVPAGAAGRAFAEELAGVLAAADPGPMLTAGLRDTLAASVAELGGIERLGAGASGGSAGGRAGFRHPASVHLAPVSAALAQPGLLEERFGPVVVLLAYSDADELRAGLDALPGQLTGTIHADVDRDDLIGEIADRLASRCGRVIFDGFPTGVSVTAAMHHGGPYPAATDAAHTSVGTTAIRRFQRPVCWQDAPQPLLPAELRDENPRAIWRRVDGELTNGACL
jgi:NADP-dependent aldehyde dehydrogenase